MPITDQKSSFQIEMENRSQDLLRVYNPTDNDYVVKWDIRSGAKLFRVPAKEETILVRYIARKYVVEMFNKIITEKAGKAILEENERRTSKGMAQMDKTTRSGEQLQFEAKFYTIGKPEIRTIMDAIEAAHNQGKVLVADNNPYLDEPKKDAIRLISVLYLGVESQYGVDTGPVDNETAQLMGGSLKDMLESSMEKPKQEVKKDEPKNFKCDYPGCDFETTHKVALFGHKKSHADVEMKKQQAVSNISA